MLLLHMSRKPLKSVRQSLLWEDRWTELNTKVTYELADLPHLAFNVRHFLVRYLILRAECIAEKGQLHLQGIDTLLQIIVKDMRNTSALALLCFDQV